MCHHCQRHSEFFASEAAEPSEEKTQSPKTNIVTNNVKRDFYHVYDNEKKWDKFLIIYISIDISIV